MDTVGSYIHAGLCDVHFQLFRGDCFYVPDFSGGTICGDFISLPRGYPFVDPFQAWFKQPIALEKGLKQRVLLVSVT